MTTVHAAFDEVAARRGDAEFLCVESKTAEAYGIDAGPRSWREVAGEVDRLRRAYALAGYGHGHRVGLVLENRPAFFAHWLALNALGVSIVPIHADLPPAEWTYLIGHSEIALAVAARGREAALRSAASQAGVQLETIGAEAAGRIPPARTPARLAVSPPGRACECALVYTAGTAGRPKACRLSNAYFLRAGAWYLGLGGLAAIRPDEDRFITPLPVSHLHALAFSSMAAILSGGTLIQLDRFHPRRWWQSVRESRATVAHHLGPMPGLLLEAPSGEDDTGHGLRFGFGAGVDPRHHAAFEQRFGFPLLECWTMTEVGGAAAIVAHREPRHVGTRCFGRADVHVETRVVDDDGVDVDPGRPGELLVRAAGDDPRRDFFLGYLKDDEATQAVWAGGWFHTGDLVTRDPEGDFHFIDRRRNVIRRGRETISAVEVESVLNTHPAVAATAVAPTPDPKRGDEVLACVVLRRAEALPPLEQVASSIARHALERLAYFKAPAYVAFVEQLPLTPSRRIQRSELRELAKRLPGAANCFDTRMLKRRKRALDAQPPVAAALPTGPGTLGGSTTHAALGASDGGGAGSAAGSGSESVSPAGESTGTAS